MKVLWDAHSQWEFDPNSAWGRVGSGQKTFGCVIFKNLHSQKKLLAVSFSKTSTAKIKVCLYKFNFLYSRPKLSIKREKEGQGSFRARVHLVLGSCTVQFRIRVNTLSSKFQVRVCSMEG